MLHRLMLSAPSGLPGRPVSPPVAQTPLYGRADSYMSHTERWSNYRRVKSDVNQMFLINQKTPRAGVYRPNACS
jgi:hypothetical protein